LKSEKNEEVKKLKLNVKEIEEQKRRKTIMQIKGTLRTSAQCSFNFRSEIRSVYYYHLNLNTAYL